MILRSLTVALTVNMTMVVGERKTRPSFWFATLVQASIIIICPSNCWPLGVEDYSLERGYWLSLANPCKVLVLLVFASETLLRNGYEFCNCFSSTKVKLGFRKQIRNDYNYKSKYRKYPNYHLSQFTEYYFPPLLKPFIHTITFYLELS